MKPHETRPKQVETRPVLVETKCPLPLAVPCCWTPQCDPGVCFRRDGRRFDTGDDAA